MMPAPMIAATASPAFSEIVEARQHASRLLRIRRELDGDFGDHRQQAFRTVDQREQVVTGGIERFAAEFDDVAVDQNGAHAPHIVHGEAILQAVHAAGVFGDIAADSARDLRRWVGRIVEAVHRGRLRDPKIAHARLDDGSATQWIDRENAIEFRQRKDDALAVRRGAARESGAGTARDHRQPRRMTEFQDADDLCFVLRQQHRQRLLTKQRQPIAFIGPRPLGGGDDRRRREEVGKRG